MESDEKNEVTKIQEELRDAEKQIEEDSVRRTMAN